MCDQEARDHEEDIDPDEASWYGGKTRVVQEDEAYGDCPQPFDVPAKSGSFLDWRRALHPTVLGRRASAR
ncbi:MAG TPA: hypothetical protein VFR23_18905 [Jiangellaceae bacterium]|nr:hypothetical protein [Jiangellaceae bacterium]